MDNNDFDKWHNNDSNMPTSDDIFFNEGDKPVKNEPSIENMVRDNGGNQVGGPKNDDFWTEYYGQPVVSTPRKNPNRLIVSVITVVIVIATLLGAGLLGWYIGKNQSATHVDLDDMPLTEQIYELISEHYYKDIDKEEYDKYAAMGLSAIMDQFSGMIVLGGQATAAYGLSIVSDAYNNHYLTDVADALDGRRAGVQVTLTQDGWSEVTNGKSIALQRGDRLIAINDINVVGMDRELLTYGGLLGDLRADIVVAKSNGEFYRYDNLVKGFYSEDTASYTDLGGGISMIRLNTFSGEDISEFEKAAVEFRDSANEKLILDLRGNGGGSTTNLSVVASYLLDRKGKRSLPINRIIDKHGKEYIYYTNHESDDRRFVGENKENYQLVVLMDKNSASASEALIGALKYYQPDTIFVGSETYGKGIAQQDFDVDGYNIVMHITIGYFDVPIVGENGSLAWGNFHEKPFGPSVGGEIEPFDVANLDCNPADYYNNDIREELAVRRAIEILSAS